MAQNHLWEGVGGRAQALCGGFLAYGLGTSQQEGSPRAEVVDGATALTSGPSTVLPRRPDSNPPVHNVLDEQLECQRVCQLRGVRAGWMLSRDAQRDQSWGPP